MITTLENYNLLHSNTFRLNINCARWISYTSESDLYDISEKLDRHNFFSIGEGSNILFTGDYSGTILHSEILDMEMSIDANGDMFIIAGAGLKMDDIVYHTCLAGRWGMENLSHIPGEVGASVVQNVGAYGTEIKDLVDEVRCFDLQDNKFVTLKNKDCLFSYRNSLFKEQKGRYIVTKVKYKFAKEREANLEYGNLKDHLRDADSLTPMLVRDTIIAIRDEKLPRVEEIGSAGSFFKNPIISKKELENIQKIMGFENVRQIPHYEINHNEIKIPAAWLIDKCGFKGKRFGNVSVWEKQPLVIVNLTGKATPEEIIDVENKIIKEVVDKFGITLSPEVEHI